MARTVTLLGVNYSVPEPTDVGYDSQLTNYLVALANAFPQLNGSNGTLTAELDFGASFGLKSLYLKSRTANPAAAGQVRLASGDSVNFRNAANGADVALAKDSADALTWGGAYVTGNPMLGANTAAGQSIPNATATIVVYGTVELDTDSAYNAGTGRYTIPTGKGGHYTITAQVAYNASPTGATSIAIHKNTTQMKYVQMTTPAAQQSIQITAMLVLVAGDVIDIRTVQNSGGAVVLQAAAVANFFSLKRIPT